MKNILLLKESLLDGISKEDLLSIDNKLNSIRLQSKLSKDTIEALTQLREKLEQVSTEHTKTKNIVLWHIDRILNYKYIDYSSYLSRRNQQLVNNYVRLVFDRKRICIGSIPFSTILEISDRYSIEQLEEYLDILSLEDDSYLDNKDILDIYNNINTIYNIDISLFWPVVGERGHKGGGI